MFYLNMDRPGSLFDMARLCVASGSLLLLAFALSVGKYSGRCDYWPDKMDLSLSCSLSPNLYDSCFRLP